MKNPRKPSNLSKSNNDVDAFLEKVAATPIRKTNGGSGRLLFAIDATASRQPTWDSATHIQCEMFEETASIGSLAMQVAFFRGYREFKATAWTTNSNALTGPMSRVNCLGGHTQIKRVLEHALKSNKKQKINAIVYIGDCMEENADTLCHLAGKLGLVNVPVFVFQESHDITAEQCFRQIAKLSNGAYFKFDSASASKLRNLLKAVAIFAVGGRTALDDFGRKEGGEILLLANLLK